MRNCQTLATVLLFLILAGVACRSSTSPADIPGSGPERGQALFALNPLGDLPGCETCHSLTPDVTVVGPSLAKIGTEAATQQTGLSAEAYLRQSLLEPDTYLTAGFNPGAMPAYGSVLSEQDIDDLVAYMLTLE